MVFIGQFCPKMYLQLHSQTVDEERIRPTEWLPWLTSVRVSAQGSRWWLANPASPQNGRYSVCDLNMTCAYKNAKIKTPVSTNLSKELLFIQEILLLLSIQQLMLDLDDLLSTNVDCPGDDFKCFAVGSHRSHILNVQLWHHFLPHLSCLDVNRCNRRWTTGSLYAITSGTIQYVIMTIMIFSII